MRWSIRYQLLPPLGLLLLGVVGLSGWTAASAARNARQRIAEQVGRAAQTLEAGQYTLTEPILQQMKGLSGADYLLLTDSGERVDRKSTRLNSSHLGISYA